MTKITKGRSEPNLLPSKAAQRKYLREIRSAADGGDVVAMSALIGLARLDEILKTQQEIAMHTESGFLNLSTGGWAGDQNDPKEKILAAIRANDPKSKQLPENQ